MIFANGCAIKQPEPDPPAITCEVREVTRDRYVDIDGRLVTPVEIVTLAEEFDTIDLGVAYKAQRTEAEICNGKLGEIATISKKAVDAAGGKGENGEDPGRKQ